MLSTLSNVGSHVMKNYIIPVTIPNKILYYNLDGNLNDPWGARTGTNATGNGSILSTADKYAGTHSASFNGVLGTSGSSYRLITFPSVGYGTNGVSVAFWMKRIGDCPNDYHVWAIGNLYMWGQRNAVSGVTPFNVMNNGNTGFDITNNVWTHIAVSVNSSNVVNVYINGVLLRSNITVAGSYPGTASGRIGGVPVGNGGCNLNGYIDEFKIYNKVLTQAEVTAIYNNNDN